MAHNSVMLGLQPCLFLVMVGLHAAQKIDVEPHKQLIVDLHNEYRRREKAADMMYLDWDDELAHEAAVWAKRCKFLHQENEYGENIAYDINEAKPDLFVKRILRQWYDERMRYYRSPYGCRNSCHYTQMIWSDTSHVGCAMAQCNTLLVWGQYIHNAFYLVCYYSPRGNWIGQYPYLSGTSCSRCPRGHWCNKGLCKSRESPNYSKLDPKTSFSSVYSSGATADEAVPDIAQPLTVRESDADVRLKPGPMSGRENLDDKFGNHQTSLCDDLQTVLCKAWAEQGECERNSDAMGHYCKRSCGLCPRDNGDVIGDENTHVIRQSDEQCEDMYESRQCQIWATVGECELNPVSMEHYCKRSCGLCDPMARGFSEELNYTPVKDDTGTVIISETKAPQPSGKHGKKKNKKKCKDTFTKKKCKFMYRMGMCKVAHLQSWMRSNCGKTCGFCSKRKYRAGLLKKVGSCQDNRIATKCQRLKDKGYCTTKKKKMRRKCAATCGLCGDEPT